MVCIFDLDGTLADCTHRRHYVDASMNPDFHLVTKNEQGKNLPKPVWRNIHTGEKFIRKWQPFYENCDQDKPIEPTIEILRMFIYHRVALRVCNEGMKVKECDSVQIWSGRCESVRQKTIDWLVEHVCGNNEFILPPLKMRPIGDSTPDNQLKEKWLDEHIASGGKPIEMVFDNRYRVLRMWERRGIWTFNCNQGKGEF